MFCECLCNLPAELHPWEPCPPIQRQDLWQALPLSTRQRVIAGGEHFLKQELPHLTASQYLSFTRCGSRTTYEIPYFLRRRMLCHLVAAECCENQGRFLDRIVDLLWMLCEESGWQVPAHNTYIRDTPQLPLPDTQHPIIDLFAAETGALLAMTCYLLREPLDNISPSLCQRVAQELEHRIFSPYLNCHFWWMGRGQEMVNNWTPWCTQNVLVAAFATPLDEVTRKSILRKAACSLDSFVGQYEEDGCCDEGAQYYGAAAVCLFGALEVLAAVAPEAFAPLWQQPKLHAMAEFIEKVHVADKYYLNFSDCSPVAGRRTGREYHFAKQMQLSNLMAFAAEDFQKDPDPDMLDDAYLSGGINLYYMVLQVFSEEEISRCTLQYHPVESCYFPSTGLLVARKGPYVLGAKAGCNDDSHNHNDTGSITLYKNGQPFLIDIGVENYTKKTFSPQRYEIWTMQSRWHNLPSFQGIDQLAGPQYCAKDVQWNLSPEQDSLQADIVNAYPPIDGLQYYRRKSVLTAQGLTMTDETDYPHEVTLTLMFRQQPTIDNNRIIVEGLGSVTCSDCTLEVEPVKVTDSRLLVAWPETIWKVTVRFTHTFTITVQ